MFSNLKRRVRAFLKIILNGLFSSADVFIENNFELKVAVLMLTHLGDGVIYFPFMGAILGCRKFQNPIYLIVKAPLQEMFAPAVNLRVIGFPCPWVGAGKWAHDFWDWIRLIRRLRAEKFDLVVVTHPHFLTSLTARLTGAHSVGYVEEGDRLLHKGFYYPQGHVSRRGRLLLKELGVAASAKMNWCPFPEAKILSGRNVAKRSLVASFPNIAHQAFICVHPGAGGAAKVWPWQNFVKLLADVFSATGYPVVLVGGPNETQTCRLMFLALREYCPVVDLSGQLEVTELFGVFGAASIYIGNDSGPSHLAAASGTPVFSIFGPASDPDVWRPEGALSRAYRVENASFYEASSIYPVVEQFNQFLRIQNISC